MKFFNIITLFFTIITCSKLRKITRDHTYTDNSCVRKTKEPDISLGQVILGSVFVLPFIGAMLGYILSGLIIFLGFKVLYHGLIWMFSY